MPKGVYQRESVAARFNQKVNKTDSCWLWTAKLFWSGYGSLRVDGKHVVAHRVAWELHHGPIPNGLEVCHRCDVRHCVNPDHLFLGTRRDNTLDAVAKGRHPRGELQGRAKLTEAQVMEARSMWASGVPGNHLARRFGVASRTMWDVLYRKHWKHVA